MSTLAIAAAAQRGISVVVGNPPYQTDVVAIESEAQHRTVMNVFQEHQITALLLGQRTALVYPGGRWINRSGKGMALFGYEQINADSLQRVILWPQSREVFPSVLLGDGISVVFHDTRHPRKSWILDYRSGKENLFTANEIPHPGEAMLAPDPRVQAILSKSLTAARTRGEAMLSERTTVQKTFGLESNFVALNPTKIRVLADEPDFEDRHLWCKIFTNDAAGKGGRAQWFWILRSEIKTGHHYIDRWKVIVSSMNPAGSRGTGHSPLAEILGPGELFGRSRIALATFESEDEARNFFYFAKTVFARFHYGALGDSQRLLGAVVPDFGRFLSDSPLDFTLPLEELSHAIATLYGLDAADEAFMAEWTKRLSPFAKELP